MKDVNEQVGARVRAIREGRGLRLFDLAVKCEGRMLPGKLSNLELGKQRWTVDDVLLVAKALGVTAAELMGERESSTAAA